MDLARTRGQVGLTTPKKFKIVARKGTRITVLVAADSTQFVDINRGTTKKRGKAEPLMMGAKKTYGCAARPQAGRKK
jgi:hypothetical protein